MARTKQIGATNFPVSIPNDEDKTIYARLEKGKHSKTLEKSIRQGDFIQMILPNGYLYEEYGRKFVLQVLKAIEKLDPKNFELLYHQGADAYMKELAMPPKRKSSGKRKSEENIKKLEEYFPKRSEENEKKSPKSPPKTVQYLGSSPKSSPKSPRVQKQAPSTIKEATVIPLEQGSDIDPSTMNLKELIALAKSRNLPIKSGTKRAEACKILGFDLETCGKMKRKSGGKAVNKAATGLKQVKKAPKTLSSKHYTRAELEKLKVPELRQIFRDQKHSGYSKMNKAQMVQYLADYVFEIKNSPPSGRFEKEKHKTPRLSSPVKVSTKTPVKTVKLRKSVPKIKTDLGRPYVIASATEQNQRDYNEDTMFERHVNIQGEKGIMLGVFDGHGGDRVSKFLAKHFPVYLEEGINKKGFSESAIQEIFASFDEKHFLHNPEYRRTGGSTATIALILPDMLYTFNLGDSKIVALDGNNNIVHSTVEHKPELSEKSRIKQAGGNVQFFDGTYRVNGFLATSRAFGDVRGKKTHNTISGMKNYPVSNLPDVQFMSTKGFKTLLVMSDGVSDFWGEEMMNLVKVEPIEKLPKTLIQYAIMEGATDNATCIAFQFTDNPQNGSLERDEPTTNKGEKKRKEKSPPKRTVNQAVKKEVEDIREHYNLIAEQGPKQEESQIQDVRKFNNWIKATLIHYGVEKAPKTKINALDVCCGKGGDLSKWSHEHVNYLLMCDVSDKSIDEAEKRYENFRGYKPKANFVVADCFASSFSDEVKKNTPAYVRKYTICSCQFALHYAFQTQQRVENFFKAVSDNLVLGGTFVCTTTNAEELVKRALHSKDKKTFGNALYQVEFEKPVKNVEEMNHFGIRYTFTLAGSVEKLDEFLVPLDLLEKIAEKYHLSLQLYGSLPQFSESMMKKQAYKNMHDKMRVKLLSKMDAEIASLYVACVFQKMI